MLLPRCASFMAETASLTLPQGAVTEPSELLCRYAASTRKPQFTGQTHPFHVAAATSAHSGPCVSNEAGSRNTVCLQWPSSVLPGSSSSIRSVAVHFDSSISHLCTNPNAYSLLAFGSAFIFVPCCLVLSNPVGHLRWPPGCRGRL